MAYHHRAYLPCLLFGEQYKLGLSISAWPRDRASHHKNSKKASPVLVREEKLRFLYRWCGQRLNFLARSIVEEERLFPGYGLTFSNPHNLQISYEDGTKSRLLNVEISYRGDCTYAVVNEAEKALYRLHNETIYTAYVKDCVCISLFSLINLFRMEERIESLREAL